MPNLWNNWWRSRDRRTSHAGRGPAFARRLSLEPLEDRTVPSLTLSTPTLDFGSDPVGVLSPAPRSTYVSNSDPNNVLLSVTPGGANAGDFTLLNAPAVGQPLATSPQGLRFVFTPRSLGAESATYTLGTSDGNLTVTLTGTGTNPVALTSPNLDFGAVAEGSTGPSIRSTSVYNQDPNNVLQAVTAAGPNAGDFHLATGPAVGQALPTGPQAFRFLFTPTTAGPESATYTVATSDGNLTFNLTGQGVGGSLTSPNLDFGPVSVGTTGPSVRSTALLNQDPNNVLQSVTLSGPNAGDFQVAASPAVGQALPTTPSAFRFTFSPTAAGPESATYTLVTSDGTYTGNLTGQGSVTGGPATETLNHSSVAFGNVAVGTSSGQFGVGLWNLGQNVQLLSVSSSSPNAADFPLLSPNPLPVNQPLPVATDPNTASLSLKFGFNPSVVGAESAVYTIHTSAGDVSVTLTGTGTSPISLNHSSVAFGDVMAGTSAAPLGVGLWNLGQNVQLLGISSSSPLAGDFPLVSPSPVPLNQALAVSSDPYTPSLSLKFGFNPSMVGTETATYTIHTSAGDLTVTLTGNGTSPITLNRPSLDFGSSPVGSPSAPLSVGLYSFGQNVQLLGVSSNSPQAGDFQLVSPNPLPINQALPVAQTESANAGSQPSLSLRFVFTPSVSGAEQATFTIHTSVGDLLFTLTGTGI